MREQWASNLVVTRGKIHTAQALPGFIAVKEEKNVGLITFHINGNQCEIVSLNSLNEREGIGSNLIDYVCKVAKENKCRRIWIITTNDNIEALRFFQKRGFALVTIHRNAIEESRRLKPEIPSLGKHNIPIRDEIELEMIL
ncbi:MAG: GNAT family N-acetyltransferase [Planctomycetes bacterium]|nr:GNAT family N-acetyltransferase [Planctomycetota bacterium]